MIAINDGVILAKKQRIEGIIREMRDMPEKSGTRGGLAKRPSPGYSSQLYKSPDVTISLGKVTFCEHWHLDDLYKSLQNPQPDPVITDFIADRF